MKMKHLMFDLNKVRNLEELHSKKFNIECSQTNTRPTDRKTPMDLLSNFIGGDETRKRSFRKLCE